MSTEGDTITNYFRKLVKKRNKKYGKAWLKENAKKAVAAREAKRKANV